jgi:hypothetical protein
LQRGTGASGLFQLEKTRAGRPCHDNFISPSSIIVVWNVIHIAGAARPADRFVQHWFLVNEVAVGGTRSDDWRFGDHHLL